MNTPLLGILLTLLAYIIGTYLAKKLNNVLLNKFVLAITLVMVTLTLLRIEFDTYNLGGSMVTFFLPIVVVCLAIPLYKNQAILQQYKWIFLFALIFGLLLNMVLVYLVLKVFDLPYALSIAMYTKSITAPMAAALHDILEADRNIAILMVTIASFVAGIFGKLIIKMTGTKNEISKGIALGLFSHVIGSIVAVEESEEAGGIAVAILTLAGVITVIILPILVEYLV